MLWFGFWRVAPFGTGQLRAHANTLCYDDDYELCSTICMFYERKIFCEIFSSLTEPVAHKIIYYVVGKGKEKASEM